jgi:DNA polymerase II large subunit
MFCHPMFHAAMRRDCDGDESCFFLLMDGFLNFSTAYLPRHRGGTMDAPLVLTSIINPSEVDDMYQNLDIVWKYPLEFYEAAIATKKPWDVKIKLAGSTLNKPEQFEGLGFTHDTTDFNEGVTCSAYKTLPSMKDKLDGQMRLAEKIDAVDEADVASIVIKKHFLRDIKGNMRTFSQQEFRCIKCNTKYRRPPIIGKCTKCGLTKIVFTVNQASVVKYLEMSINLAKKYNISPYTKQALDVLRVQADGMFGKETEKQTGLSGWM